MQEYGKAATPQLYYRTLKKVKVLEGAAAQANAVKPIAFADPEAHLNDGRGQSAMKFGGYGFRGDSVDNIPGDSRQ